MAKKNVRKRAPQQADGAPTKAKTLASFKHDYSKDYADPKWPYHHGGMDRGAKMLLIVFPLLIITWIAYIWYSAHLRDLVKTPLDAPKIIDQQTTSALEDPERFWGTYRSGLYFGLKTRSPKSPVVGLMWMQQFGQDMPPPIRHWCDQGDGLPMYGWFSHDGANFGIHETLDQYYTVSTDFVKRPGGLHGGDWSARIRVKARPGAEKAIMSLFFYMALDGQGSLQPDIKGTRLASIYGSSQELGNFELKFPKSSGKNIKYDHLVTYAPSLATLKESLAQGLGLKPWGKEGDARYISLAGHRMPRDSTGLQPNFLVHQVTVTLPYEMEVSFESGSMEARPNQLTGDVYQAEIMKHLDAFSVKFEKTFHLKEKNFEEDKISFAKAALSNMLGGMGYFYGSSKVQSVYNKEPVDYWPAPLYTAVPSRSSFPRGFLWDEGFHNLLISKWDSTMSMDVIGHWLDLMNTEGWIPREQILGEEARAKVPEEFVVQRNKNANPPTLFLPLQSIVKQLIHSNDPKDKQYLERMFPRLQTWYNWFNTTQQGNKPFTYRWQGRDPQTEKEINPRTLTSGLDDYPRASHPTDDEHHVDLRCWMALASDVMADIAKSLGKPYQQYAATYQVLTDNVLLDQLHWSERAQRYSDYGLHTDSVKLERPKPPKNLQPGQRPPPQAMEKRRVVKKEPSYQFVDTTFGYVSLFPFLLKIVQPDSLKLGQVLKDIQDPNLLWTKYGLRSLAKNAPLYNKHNTEHDPPYWRGGIWININYLVLRALDHYSNTEGPYKTTAKSVYQELRENIINNIYQQYRNTGYIWEHYDDNTGQGHGVHPFTGWSALVVAIMAEEY